MSSPDDKAPLRAAPDDLSPAVRRLVRQFDLDVTGIHGTGPSGRIRVSDVMGMIGGRTDSGNRDAPLRGVIAEGEPALSDDPEPCDDARPADEGGSSEETAPLDAAEPPHGTERPDDAEPPHGTERPRDAERRSGAADGGPTAATQARASVGVPTTTVFDCDLGRVLAHRKTLRGNSVELLTTSYFLTALATALDAAPEITAGQAPLLGVLLTMPDGTLRSALIDFAAVGWDSALADRVLAVDAALRSNMGTDPAAGNLLVHHYGESGSVLATPTPIGDDHAASVGIGRVRREVVVRTVNGAEAARLAARCYLSLSFCADRVPLHHANRALAAAVQILENWPE
jgi:2-oxoglutarate dehydrogenase E2 component (dihydrolipoamide succinyltransferase)